MNNFRIKGPLTKMMRWFSWFESAKFYTGESYGLKFVLDYHFSAGGALESAPPESVVVIGSSDPKTELQLLKSQMGGTRRLAPKLVTAKNIWVKDLLLVTGQASWLTFGRNSKECKTPSHALMEAVSDAKPEW